MEPELKQVLGLLLRRAWFIGLVAAVFCGGVYYQHDKYAVPKYEAVSKLIVRASDSVLIDTLKEILTTPVILEPTAERHPELGMSAADLRSRVSVATSEKSQVMSISVQDPSAERAAAIVRAVAETYREEVPKVVKVDGVSILSDSGTSDKPRDVSQSLTSKLMIAFVLSLIAAVGLILLREYFDDRIRTERDASRATGKPVLAVVGRVRKSDLRTRQTGAAESAKLSKAGEPLNVGIHQ